MGVLQQELDRLTKEFFGIESLSNELIRQISNQRQLNLTEGQIIAIASSLRDGATNSVAIDVDEAEGDIEINEQELEAALASLTADLDKRTERAVMAAIQELPPDVLSSLYADAPAALRHRRAQDQQFRKRLKLRWKEGLDRLEMLIMIAQEAGGEHLAELTKQNDQGAARGPLADDDIFLIDALVLLHARACRIASEVLCLLQGGFADGANARWRSLHEVAVTAMFLAEHQGDLPKRYLDHVHVEAARSAKQYQQHCETLGYTPYSEIELSEINRQSVELIQEYGNSFSKDYGWASGVLKGNPTFTQIEASLDMSHWRPFYKLACQSVHAGSHAIHSSLSIPVSQDDVLLAGASNAGLCDPGHTTAISLMMASVALFTIRPTLDSLVVCGCMKQLCHDIGNAFLAAHELLDEECKSGEQAQ